jgi:hypothetical protein
MTTREVCQELDCTERHVYNLRSRTYPKGHAKAGRPVLGNPVRAGRGYCFDKLAVLEYKAWLIAGKPLDTRKSDKRDERMGRALQRASA